MPTETPLDPAAEGRRFMSISSCRGALFVLEREIDRDQTHPFGSLARVLDKTEARMVNHCIEAARKILDTAWKRHTGQSAP